MLSKKSIVDFLQIKLIQVYNIIYQLILIYVNFIINLFNLIYEHLNPFQHA